MKLGVYFCVAFSCLLSSCSTAPAQQETLVELSKIAGKPKDAVETALGKGTSEGFAHPKGVGCDKNDCPKRTYKDGAVEVVYMNGKADWITLSLKGGKFEPGALSVIGLPATEPTTANDNVIRWDNVAGYKEISCFPAQNGAIDYFYIKTATE